VITEETTFTVTGAHIVALLMGKALFELIMTTKGLAPEVIDGIRNAFTKFERKATPNPALAAEFQAMLDAGMTPQEAMLVQMGWKSE
jgi:hypothetical protein